VTERKCPVCDKENMTYPECDWSTGFIFCDGCMRKAEKIYLNKVKGMDESDNFVCWLRSIAEAREATMAIKKGGKKE